MYAIKSFGTDFSDLDSEVVPREGSTVLMPALFQTVGQSRQTPDYRKERGEVCQCLKHLAADLTWHTNNLLWGGDSFARNKGVL